MSVARLELLPAGNYLVSVSMNIEGLPNSTGAEVIGSKREVRCDAHANGAPTSIAGPFREVVESIGGPQAGVDNIDTMAFTFPLVLEELEGQQTQTLDFKCSSRVGHVVANSIYMVALKVGTPTPPTTQP
jgi:hypothetical protein